MGGSANDMMPIIAGGATLAITGNPMAAATVAGTTKQLMPQEQVFGNPSMPSPFMLPKRESSRQIAIPPGAMTPTRMF